MIYTKKGDKGKTSLVGFKKSVRKDNPIICALGSLDEANSYLGIAKLDFKRKVGVYKKLEEIQKDLMTISSVVVGAKLTFPKKRTGEIEKEIDIIEKRLPPLKHFIIPEGHLMYARALVRKAEREVVRLKRMPPEILKYLNRLSDYLFNLHRWENKSV